MPPIFVRSDWIAFVVEVKLRRHVCAKLYDMVTEKNLEAVGKLAGLEKVN